MYLGPHFITSLSFLLDLEMLHHLQMEDSLEDNVGALMDGPPYMSEPPLSITSSTIISEQEFSCHCCYDILVNPTTLTCGHNFCRHCLALWWESSHKNECPECREKWEGFPKINILLRYALLNQAWMNTRCVSLTLTMTVCVTGGSDTPPVDVLFLLTTLCQ